MSLEIDWVNQFTVFLLTTITVSLKGFQYKNVIGNHIKMVVLTSYLMALCDVLFIGVVAQNGWSVCFAAGSGAALAMYLSIKLHDRIFKKANPA